MLIEFCKRWLAKFNMAVTNRSSRQRLSKQHRQHLASFPQVTFRERGCVVRLLRSHIDGSGATANVSGKAGGWLDHTRSAHSHEHRAFTQGTEDPVQSEGHFAEPADVRANPSATLATGNLGWRIIGVSVAKWRSAACIAAALVEFPVHMDHVFRSCLLVEVINVLRAEEKAFLEPLFETGERDV
jgi:hypothetical protein